MFVIQEVQRMKCSGKEIRLEAPVTVRAFLLEHGATTLVDTPKDLLQEILK